MQKQTKLSGKTVPSSHGVDADGLAARISVAVNEIGSLVRAGEIAGVSDETIAKWRDGRSRPPFLGMVALCQASGKSLDWMATGESGRDSSTETSHVDGTQPEQGGDMGAILKSDQWDAEMIVLPRLDVQASAGPGIIAQSEAVTGFMAFHQQYLREIGVNPRFAHQIQVEGDSMAPTLRDKEWIVVDTSIDSVLSDALYAVVYAGVVLVKRVQMMRDGSLILSSDNKSAGYLDERVAVQDLPDLHIVGRVKGHFRPM